MVLGHHNKDLLDRVASLGLCGAAAPGRTDHHKDHEGQHSTEQRRGLWAAIFLVEERRGRGRKDLVERSVHGAEDVGKGHHSSHRNKREAGVCRWNKCQLLV